MRLDWVIRFLRSTPRALSALAVLAFAAPLAAATLEVQVTDFTGAVLPGATVVLVEAGREAVTGPEGVARFDNVAAGRHHVSVRFPGLETKRSEVVVSDSSTPIKAAVALGNQVHFSESVTVSPGARDTFESYQPATVLGGPDLQERLASTLGATLGSEPGVNVRSFGAGNARPVIRGLDGDRVLVLENGVRTADLSFQSGDHAITVDPAGARQIEVVRGPATLLYGSNAIGGVVNVVSEDIPMRSVDASHGRLSLQGGTANREGGGSGAFWTGNGRWALRVEGSGRRTGDYETPEGDVPNSQSDMVTGGAAASRTFADGYAGLSYHYDRTKYGIPFVEDGGVQLNPRRHRFDFRAEKRNLGTFLDGIKVDAGYRNYTHDELESTGEVATSFHNKVGQLDILLNHRPLGRAKGTFGLQGLHRDYSAEGEEALAPPTTQGTLAAFFYEEVPFSHVSLQFGARVDHTQFRPEAAALPDRAGLRDRDFTTVSGSVGGLVYLREDVTLALSAARAVRNPNLEELYNFGPHPGNNAFEIGNPDLPIEVGYGVDLSLRWRRPRFVGEVTGFRNAIHDFIFPFQTGETEDDLPVVNFMSADSTLIGFEVHTDIGLAPRLWLELGGDGVRGELKDTDQPLPRMPPYRAWGGLRYEGKHAHLGGEVRWAAKQDRVYGIETPTDSYTLVNAHAGYTFTAGKSVHTLTVRLENAADELYRNHLSYIKDLAPEMGRTVRALYSMEF
jgi:iron complex outermembrane receptor protein